MYKTGTRQTIQANLHHVTTAYVDVGKENAHVADVHLGVGNLAPLTLLVGRTEYAYPAVRDMETGSLEKPDTPGPWRALVPPIGLLRPTSTPVRRFCRRGGHPYASKKSESGG